MNIQFDFSGRTTIVTGASSGIGKRIALDLLSYGAHVLACSRNEETLLRSFESVGNVTLISTDLTTSEGVKKLVEKAKCTFSSIDYLVICHGVFSSVPLSGIDETTLNQHFEINVKSYIRLIRDTVAMLESGKGKSIVTLSSILAHRGGENVSLYACTKGGLSSLTKALAVEYGGGGIRINSVSPGHVMTGMIADIIDDKAEFSKIVEEYPLGRIGQPSDISPMVLFLLSDAASWITGCDYLIDGGRSCRS